jgi:hypothetical protein
MKQQKRTTVQPKLRTQGAQHTPEEFSDHAGFEPIESFDIHGASDDV